MNPFLWGGYLGFIAGLLMYIAISLSNLNNTISKDMYQIEEQINYNQAEQYREFRILHPEDK